MSEKFTIEFDKPLLFRSAVAGMIASKSVKRVLVAAILYFIALYFLSSGWQATLWVSVLVIVLIINIFLHYFQKLKWLDGAKTMEAEWILEEEFLTISSKHGTSTTPWTAIKELRKFKTFWLLKINKSFSTLPTKNLTNEQKEFISDHMNKKDQTDLEEALPGEISAGPDKVSIFYDKAIISRGTLAMMSVSKYTLYAFVMSLLLGITAAYIFEGGKTEKAFLVLAIVVFVSTGLFIRQRRSNMYILDGKDIKRSNLTFTNDVLYSEGSSASKYNLPWNSVEKLYKYKTFWLLRAKSGVFFILPITNLTEAQKAFVTERVNNSKEAS